MRAFWKGTISFGMVNIPVSVFPATKSKELSFHLLHAKDGGRIHNERVCDKCGKTVPYPDLIKGFEYEKNEHVPMSKEDFEKVAVEAEKNISILDFVEAAEIDPMFFDKPYYMVPEKNGQKAYGLLRMALERTKKVGIGKIVFHTREHLAAIKPTGQALGNLIMLDVMHFSDEIKQPDEVPLPQSTTEKNMNKKELEMAEKLIETMTEEFNPEKYQDTYRENLLQLIEKKKRGEVIKTKPGRKEETNVIDIMSRLKESLEQTKKQKAKPMKKSA